MAALLLPLAWFKYYGFFALNVTNAFESLGLHPPLPLLQVLLPIGISFYTFMAISYVVDVSRYEIQVSRWLDVSVYLSFFPHLIAGPIVRGEELIPQIRRPRDAGRIDVSRASFLIVGGLFKKMVISAFLASQIVDPVFGAPNTHGGLEVLVAIYAYAIVIYADFSAYSDIAIGVALLLGFEFPANFDRPYTAVSLRDFWRRWHMTLSRWLRDYLYIPLGGSRHGEVRTAVNIMITMLLGGLWHGAGWTFVAWGAFHGIGQVIGRWRVRRATGARHRRTLLEVDRRPQAAGDVQPRRARVGVLPRGLDRERVRAPRPAGLGRDDGARDAARAADDRGDARHPVPAGRSRGAAARELRTARSRAAGRRARAVPVRDHDARRPGREPVHLLPLLR